MTVLQVLLHNGIGGMETFARALHQEFNRPSSRCEIITIDGPEGQTRPRRIRSRYSRITTAISQHHPNVVIAHSAMPSIYARAAIRGQVPTITVLHSGADDYRNPVLKHSERLLLPYTDHIIAVSDHVADNYLRHFPGARRKLSVIPNGVCVPNYEPGLSSSSNSSRTRLLFAGRLVPMKQLHLLITALGHRSLWADVELKIAGDGDDRYVASCKALARSLPSDASVSFLGSVSGIYPLLEDTEILVHPSLFEAQGLALLEAAMHGLPCIVSEEVARELPRQQVVVTFRSGDPLSLAQAIRNTITNRAHLQSQARKSMSYFRANFSTRAISRRYREIIARVLKPDPQHSGT